MARHLGTVLREDVLAARSKSIHASRVGEASLGPFGFDFRDIGQLLGSFSDAFEAPVRTLRQAHCHDRCIPVCHYCGHQL